MNHIALFLDESGAKGYSDRPENAVGELGVAAGALIPVEHIDTVESHLEGLLRPYQHDGKFHITDLPPERQGDVRNDVFAYMYQVNWRWLYQALYVEGFHSQFLLTARLQDEARERSRSEFKVSSNRSKDLLHAELLAGAALKAAAFCLDYLDGETQLEIYTDRIDEKVKRLFEEQVERLLYFGEKRAHDVKGFNPKTREKISGTISFEITSGHDALGDFSGVSFAVNISESPIVVVADILANTMNYQLTALQQDKPGSALETVAALAGHPVASLVYGIQGQESQHPNFTDTLFRHPKSLEK